MKDLFLNLTLSDGKPIIIGVNNIASIVSSEDGSETEIQMNFARNKDLWSKKYSVKESFEQIKNMIFK